MTPLSSIADATRVRILSALAITEMCVTDISRVLEINQTTVSHQLRLLKNLNAVTTKRQGKIVFYALNNIFSYLGAVNTWSPIAVAITPTAGMLFAAAVAMYLVERR